jgi:hypothetical protein
MFGQQTTPLTTGDLAILRFSMMNEVVAADIWSQMADIMANNANMRIAAGTVDPLLPRIILEIARNERSHAAFLTAYWGEPRTAAARVRFVSESADCRADRIGRLHRGRDNRRRYGRERTERRVLHPSCDKRSRNSGHAAHGASDEPHERQHRHDVVLSLPQFVRS